MKVGVIGAGYWGRKIVTEYLALAEEGRVESVVVCDTDKRRFAPFRNEPRASYVGTADALFASDVQAINICTANESHYPLAMQGIEAGKHVLVEKPMTMDSRQGYDLVLRAQEAGRVLAVGHVYRFNNAVHGLKEMLKRGDLGDVYHFKLEWATLCDPVPGRDILWDLAPHPFDILHFLTGEWPEAITCRARPIRRPTLEELAYITVELPSGPLAQIDLSWVTPGKTREIVAVGSKGSVRVDTLAQRTVLHVDGADIDVSRPANNTIRDELLHFVDCAKDGRPAVNGNLVGARVVSLIEHTIKSSRTGRTVPVSLKPLRNLQMASSHPTPGLP